MMNQGINDTEVSWNVLDIPVHGTITAPKGTGTRSGVVLVAGSGPTDRNWCSPALPGTNGSGKLLAEALAARGFVTLRYDKLASGPHVKENLPRFSGRLSMQSHADELKGAVEKLLSEANIDRDHIFVLTNSEGAIHAVNYQLQTKKNRLRGMVLTGAPGRPVGDVGRSQILNQMGPLPGGEIIMKHYDEDVARFLNGRAMVLDPSMPEGLKVLLRALENRCNMPFARELWSYSLPEHVARVEEPLLVMIGKKDIQIDWKVYGGELEKVIGQRPSVSFSYPDDANHVLKHEERPVEKLTADYVGAHYNAPDAVLDPEATRAIIAWLENEQQ